MNIEIENEAFDRYTRNVNLLEEVFDVKSSTDGPTKDGGSPTSDLNTTSAEDDRPIEIAEIKAVLRSDPTRAENFRNRMQRAVDEGLKKLQKFEAQDGGAGSSEQDKFGRSPEKKKFGWSDSLAVLIDKLNKARNEEDLKVCLQMNDQLFNQHSETTPVEYESAAVPMSLESDDVVKPQSESAAVPMPLDCDDVVKPQFADPPLKWFTVKRADAEEIERMNKYFDSLEDIEEL